MTTFACCFLSLFVGFVAGVFTAALLAIAARSDDLRPSNLPRRAR